MTEPPDFRPDERRQGLADAIAAAAKDAARRAIQRVERLIRHGVRSRTAVLGYFATEDREEAGKEYDRQRAAPVAP